MRHRSGESVIYRTHVAANDFSAADMTCARNLWTSKVDG